MATTYKPIPGYPGYHAGTDGSIMSTRQISIGHTLKPVVDKAGRLNYNLMVNGEQTPARGHTLVLLAYKGPKPTGTVCRHLDGNPSNNCPGNLCWGTYTENQEDAANHGTAIYPKGSEHGRAKLTESDVEMVRHLYHVIGLGQVHISSFLNVSRSAIGDIIQGRTWRHTS